MAKRGRPGLSQVEKAELWTRWKAGECVSDIARALSMPDPAPREARFIAVGMDLLGRVLVVVYTHRGERARMISARNATPSERRTYEQGDS